MVGMFCGCCSTSPVPVPGGCTVCDLLWSGYPADVLAYTDNFSSVDPGWQFLQHFDKQFSAVSPNLVTDYIRNSKLYFFKSPFFSWTDNFIFSTNKVRCVPPEPLPSSSIGRQPWLNILRNANLYFPSSSPRKYAFEVTVNYPRDTLPYVNLFDFQPDTGVVGVFRIGPAGFYIFASGLSSGSDLNPNATLSVGIQPTVYPFTYNPNFEKTISVPFGTVKLRFEYTYQPITGVGVRSYFVNDVLQQQVSSNGFFFSPSTSGSDCVSACGQAVQLAAYEPWGMRNNVVGRTPIWNWNGYSWLRGGGNTASPDSMAFSATWSTANNPADKLWFDDYSMTIVSP